MPAMFPIGTYFACYLSAISSAKMSIWIVYRIKKNDEEHYATYSPR